MDHAVSKRSRVAAFRCSCNRGDRSRAPLGRAAAMLEARKDRQRMALHAFDTEMPNAARRTSRHAHGIGAFENENLPAAWVHPSMRTASQKGIAVSRMRCTARRAVHAYC